MRDAELAAWLRLALTPGLGPVKSRALLARIGLPQRLFDGQIGLTHATLASLVGADCAQALLDPPPQGLQASLERTRNWLAAGPGRFVLSLADPDYPSALLGLADAPLLLYGDGHRALLGQPALAIVGSRNASRQGEENARAFAARLGSAGLCIVSGLARGIDAAAHAGALEAGAGTIAVLGTGCDIVYPAGHRGLAARVQRSGLLLSELPLGAGPMAQHFPRRNRIIAALGCGVLVVEAALQSGSLITARIAAELGREVFAIPGSIHAPQARGCHRLIRDGAKLVESAQDIFEELRGQIPLPALATGPAARDGAEPPDGVPRQVLAALGHDPSDVDTLALRTRCDPGAVSAALLALELDGCVERLPGNRYQRLD